MNNSTISGNHGGYGGGGIYNINGITTFNNSTITRNTSGLSFGGGIYSDVGGTVRLQNSIVAGDNTPYYTQEVYGNITSLGYNAIGDAGGFTLGTGDLINVNPNLGQLIGHSGTPRYHPLLSGSPAIDAGNPTGCTDQDGNLLTTDQRGAARVGTCDIGAYEYTTPALAVSLSVVSGSDQSTATTSAFSKPLQAVALDNQGSPVSGVTIDFTAPGSGSSGTFADLGTNTTSAITDEGGVASTSTFTANNRSWYLHRISLSKWAWIGKLQPGTGCSPSK